MNSLAQTPPTTVSRPRRNRFTGWSTIASGVALLIVGQKAYFPPSVSLILLLATLAFYLGMIPVARWITNGLAARTGGDEAGVTRVPEIIDVTGAIVAATAALFAALHWLPAVPAQILDTSALGAIGLWLIMSNTFAIRARLYNRALAIIGALAGVSWLLAAVIMWIELIAGNLGSLVSAIETVRLLGGYLGAAFYLIWAVWLGVWLLIRKR